MCHHIMHKSKDLTSFNPFNGNAYQRGAIVVVVIHPSIYLWCNDDCAWEIKIKIEAIEERKRECVELKLMCIHSIVANLNRFWRFSTRELKCFKLMCASKKSMTKGSSMNVKADKKVCNNNEHQNMDKNVWEHELSEIWCQNTTCFPFEIVRVFK